MRPASNAVDAEYPVEKNTQDGRQPYEAEPAGRCSDVVLTQHNVDRSQHGDDYNRERGQLEPESE